MEEIIKCLKEPFPFEDIEWKPQIIRDFNGTKKALAVAYVDSRAIQNRLDNVVGPFKWGNQFTLWQPESQICCISIFNEDTKEWVQKQDGAENTKIEKIKGGLSDAFKRAAVMWGIGRYLYDMKNIWAEVEQTGINSKGEPTYSIKESESTKLQNFYNKYVNSPTNNNKAKQEPTSNTNPPQNASPKNQTGQKPQTQNQQPSNESPYDYEIKSKAPSGNSMCVKLVGRDGKELTTFVKDDKPDLQPGARIRNAQMEQKEASFGTYYVMNKYDVAA